MYTFFKYNIKLTLKIQKENLWKKFKKFALSRCFFIYRNKNREDVFCRNICIIQLTRQICLLLKVLIHKKLFE